MSDYVIETERLGLRRLSPGDLDDMAALLGDPEVMRYYPRPKSRDEARQWIEWNLDSYERYGHGLWASVVKETGQFIGDCGLVVQTVDGEDLVEVGYHLVRSQWRRGYASEAAAACRDHAFRTLMVPRLISLIRPENHPSRGVAERIGMTVWKETDFKDIPHLVYSMEPPSGRSGPAPTRQAEQPLPPRVSRTTSIEGEASCD